MLSCKEFTQRVTLYFDGDMPRSQRMSMWSHQFMCKDCSRYMKQIRLAIDFSAQTRHHTEAIAEYSCPVELKRNLLDVWRRTHASTEDQ